MNRQFHGVHLSSCRTDVELCKLPVETAGVPVAPGQLRFNGISKSADCANKNVANNLAGMIKLIYNTENPTAEATGPPGKRYMTVTLRKAGSNWVEGESFFDREVELESLMERIQDGNHTLLTAQRRMGKTSLVRELLSRLDERGEYETIFVDLEAAEDAGDASRRDCLPGEVDPGRMAQHPLPVLQFRSGYWQQS